MRRERALVPVGAGYRVAEVCDGTAFAGEHLEVEVEGRLTELPEPEAALVDDVDREPVAPRRNRRTDRDVEHGAFARLDPDLGPKTVPDDCVAQLVQPVVRDREAIAAPGRVAGVLEFDTRGHERAGAELGQFVRAPSDPDRPSHRSLV